MRFVSVFFFLFVFQIFALRTFGQIAPSVKDTTGLSTLGKIDVTVSERIDSLERSTRGKTELRGYRIQIFLGPFAQAKTERTKFISTGIPLPAYMPQNLPDYAVRVGDFRNMMEAQKYLSQVRDLYPSAFVVPDKIESPRLQRPDKN